MDTKECVICNTIFTKKQNCSRKDWNNRSCCSRSCNGKNLWQQGKGVTQFVKGHNFDYGTLIKKGGITPDGSRSGWEKGNQPWNKGKEGVMPIPWNKGKIGQYKLKDEKDLISPLTESIRGSKKYIKWRTDVFTRDGYKCRVCNKNCKYLNVHHIKTFSEIIISNNIKTKSEAYKVKELWDITNGVTLCQTCHKETHKQMRLNSLIQGLK